MPYPASFHRVALIGELYADTFVTTFSMVPAAGTPVAASTQALVDSVAAVVQGWWDNPLAAGIGGGISICGPARLTTVKINRINTAGHYEDPQTFQKILTTPVPGGGSGTPPPQLSIAATLVGGDPRALAGKGRMFFPPSSLFSSLGTDGRITTTNAQLYANGVFNLMAAVNDAYLSAGVVAVPGIASATRTGAFQTLKEIRVGRVIDTIRSRRNKDLEDPVKLAF